MLPSFEMERISIQDNLQMNDHQRNATHTRRQKFSHHDIITKVQNAFLIFVEASSSCSRLPKHQNHQTFTVTIPFWEEEKKQTINDLCFNLQTQIQKGGVVLKSFLSIFRTFESGIFVEKVYFDKNSY